MSLNIAILCSLKNEEEDPPPFLNPEYDSLSTILKIKEAVEVSHKASIINFDIEKTIPLLKGGKFDFVINLCEGYKGEGREMQASLILEMLGLPYSGSTPITLGICQNKVLTKKILAYYDIATPRFQIFNSENDELNNQLEFPLIVKPIYEGSSIGIYNDSVVFNKTELKERVKYVLSTCTQPALVEEYIDGREFTISIWGNEKPEVLPIIEFDFERIPKGKNKIYSFEAKWIWEVEIKDYNIFICPAKIDERLKTKLENIAVKTYKALNLRDYGRIDIRCDRNETCYILEVNPIPGFLPEDSDYSCFPASFKKAGYNFIEGMNKILNIGLKRYADRFNI